jgi:hypothetical protein
MSKAIAERLWVAARQRGGTIMLADVSESDIVCGRANGWVISAGIGHLEATEELRRVAAYSAGATDLRRNPHASAGRERMTPA